MFNQSFSVKNFRKIFNCENRKGINLERKYFPFVKQISEELKEIQSKLKALERQKPKSLSFEEQKTKLNDKKNLKEKEILSELGKLANEIKNNGWNLKISKSIHKNSKDVFSINNKDPAAYFVH